MHSQQIARRYLKPCLERERNGLLFGHSVQRMIVISFIANMIAHAEDSAGF
jgi:hypothetical protein